MHVHIEDWRNRPLQCGRYPYVYVDGLYLRRNWGGKFKNVAILVAIAVNEDGYQRCNVHFYRNVFSVTPGPKVKLVAEMLKAIHAQESKKAAQEKAKAVVAELRSMKLKEAAKEDGCQPQSPQLWYLLSSEAMPLLL